MPVTPLRSDALTPRASRAAEPEARSSREHGTRLGAALLFYLAGVTLVITLLPFRFGWPTEWRIMTSGGAFDVVANVLLFLPLGFLFRLADRRSHRHSVLRALAVGLLASMVIESLQLFEPERYTSVLDVLANGLGAWIGARLHDRVAPAERIDAGVIGRAFLELPLMGLVYLLVPLAWLHAAVAVVSPRWIWLALPLAAFAGSLLGGMQRHHFGPAGISTAGATARLAAAGAALAFFPALPRAPLPVLLLAAVTWGTAFVAGAIPTERAPGNRRFEVPVLRASVPAFAVYLLLLAAAPLASGVVSWSFGMGFPGGAGPWSKREIMRLLELVAGFTLLGYVVAEFRGRAVSRFRDAAPRVLAWASGAALVTELAFGLRPGGASVARFALVLVAAQYGAWLYHLQRAYVVQLVAEANRNQLAAGEASSAPATRSAVA